MKKILWIKTALFLLLCYTQKEAIAQYYQFTKSTTTYVPLSNPQLSVTDSIMIDTVAAFSHSTFPGINYLAFGEKISGIVEVGKNGYVVALSDSSDFVFDPFFTPLRSNGQSEFHASEIRIGPDSILEAEWRNFGIVGRPNTDYITFKVRLYLNTEIIEFHYGPSNLPGGSSFTSGPSVVLLHTNKGFMTYKEQMWLTGNPSNPTVGSSFGVLNGFPPNGTLFRFVGPNVTRIDENNDANSFVSIYPNPASEKIEVKADKAIDFLELVDSSGKLVRFEGKNRRSLTLPLEELDSGMYVVIVNFSDRTKSNSKIVIK